MKKKYISMVAKYETTIGKKFNKLLVIREFCENGRSKVECICDCGEKCVKLRAHVRTGRTGSCGCVQSAGIRNADTLQKSWDGHEKISSDYWSCIQSGAKSRNLELNITLDYIWNIYVEQQGKCAITGEPIVFAFNKRRENYKNQTASLDRIDNDKGYIKGNVWWVHKNINRMKLDMTLEEFLFLSKKVANYSYNRVDYVKWDKRFISLASYISEWSKDPSTKVGCVIYDKDNRIISTGYNGLPKTIPDEGLDDREIKYKTIIHAEINAILFARQDLTGCTLAVSPFMPCSNCSSVIIQSGISRCVFPKLIGEASERWKHSFDLARRQFSDAGVILEEYNMI